MSGLGGLRIFPKIITEQTPIPGEPIVRTKPLYRIVTMTPTQLQLMMAGCPYERAVKYFQPLLNEFDKYEINTPLRQAHFLAQVGHETGSLKYMEEIASGQEYEGRRDLGNNLIGDGKRYKGRGPFQLTGRANYREYGKFIHKDLESQPELVSDDLDICVGSAGWYWEKHKLNALADSDLGVSISKVINGGNNGLQDRLHRLEVCKKLLGAA